MGWLTFTLFLSPLVLDTSSSAEASLARISDLLSGTWKGNQNTSEEIWLPAAGNLMLGLNRDTSKPGKTFFEYLRIEIREQGVYYVAQPLGKTPVAFKLVRLEGQKAVFQNLEHDFPQIITYERPSPNRLCAAIGVPDKPDQIKWCWTGAGHPSGEVK